MAINEHLKFSWGHIIAFVAIILIGYFSFLGLTYLTDGNFAVVGISVAVILILLLFIFIGAQTLKATESHFKKKINFERALVFIAPFALIALIYPACHFWTVFDSRKEIETNFIDAVQGPKAMFAEYETYCGERINSYTSLINNERRTSDGHKANEILSLKLQLIDENFENLKNDVLSWVDNKAGKATVWNAFLIGNINSINNAIVEWNQSLVEFSEHKLPKEGSTVLSFDSDASSLNKITTRLDEIRGIYGGKTSVTFLSIIMIVLSYLFLMLPYVIQRRNTKSTYHLFYNENIGNGMISERGTKSKHKVKTNKKSAPDDIIIEMDDDYLDTNTSEKSEPSIKEEDDDEYGAFTM